MWADGELQFWGQYKEALESFWVADNVDLRRDETIWNALDPHSEVCLVLPRLLAYLAWCTTVCDQRITQKVYCDIDVPELKCFYGMQMVM